MLKYLWVFFLLFACILLEGCRDDLEYRASAGELRFSKDTVFLDTVFNGLSSSTYNFKVYNTTNDDISIPEVFLREGAGSGFRLNVNGKAGTSFTDIEIGAKDSIYVFVESTFDVDNSLTTAFLATDAVIFGNQQTQQEVALVTLVQDAVFLFPNRENGITESIPIGVDENGEAIGIEGFILPDSLLTFTNEKPYVIYGYAAVPDGSTLEIQAGARVHFHEASGILVQNGGSLQVLGTPSSNQDNPENEVIFEGDRLEPEFSEIPGQWGTIWLAPGSRNNRFRNLTVKNAIIGILAEGDPGLPEPKLQLENVRLVNSSNFNLFARNTSVTAVNTLAGDAGQASVVLSEGGRYNLLHCTVANFWGTGLRNLPALFISNYRETAFGERIVFPLQEATITNSIITGNSSIELLLERDQEEVFNFLFKNTLLQFDTTNEELLADPLYDFTNTVNYESLLRNASPGFTGEVPNPLNLAPASPAIDFGTPDVLSAVPTDILGTLRQTPPDAGAYEFSGN